MAKQNFLVSPQTFITRDMRKTHNQHSSAAFWFTGLSGAGKSTIAFGVEQYFFKRGIDIVVFDGDIIRKGLCKDLAFSPADRLENIRRIAELAHIFVEHGTICLCAFITPLSEHRKLAQSIIGKDYHEIYVSCPLEECERRDVKGFYNLAREGKIKNYTGISSPYEEPSSPELIITTQNQSVEQSVQLAVEYISRQIDISKVL